MDQRLLDFIKKKSVLTSSKIINITHEQLSSELGTARVVVSRFAKTNGRRRFGEIRQK